MGGETELRWKQCCGTVIIFTVPVPTFEKLRFRFRLLTKYGSDSGSGSVNKPKSFQTKIYKEKFVVK